MTSSLPKSPQEGGIFSEKVLGENVTESEGARQPRLGRDGAGPAPGLAATGVTPTSRAPQLRGRPFCICNDCSGLGLPSVPLYSPAPARIAGVLFAEKKDVL